MDEPFSYKKAGVDIETADAAKRTMAESVDSGDPRVLNRLGAFATLFDASFPGYQDPVLVLKSEEPGSKQKLALEHGRVESICFDLIHHLINDMIVMGAEPLSIQDTIICGRLEEATTTRMVRAMAEACRAQGCALTGGETSEQPGVLEPGSYVLTASGVGVVERGRVIDGSRIREGDAVLALASNGPHTNGYSLIRALVEKCPDLADEPIGGSNGGEQETFLEAVLRPHQCYYQALKDLFAAPGLHGLAHITGGGVAGNLRRIVPDGLEARIDLDKVRIPPVFAMIRNEGNVADDDMARTFNLGVGMVAVMDPAAQNEVAAHLEAQDCESYEIGTITRGSADVAFKGSLRW